MVIMVIMIIYDSISLDILSYRLLISYSTYFPNIT